MEGTIAPDPNRVLLFDLDNTLIECTKYYLDVEDSFVVRTAKRTKLPEPFVRELVQTIDYESAKLHDGFNRSRFPRSFNAASLALDVICGNHPDVTTAQQEEMLASLVFTAPYTPYPGALEAVASLKDAGFRVALVTKGDPDIQQYKITKNNLDNLFGPENIFVVPSKTKTTFEHILGVLEADPLKSWMTGDSLKDDIHPNNELGLTTVHITDSHQPWRWEDKHAEATHTANNVAALAAAILSQ